MDCDKSSTNDKVHEAASGEKGYEKRLFYPPF